MDFKRVNTDKDVWAPIILKDLLFTKIYVGFLSCSKVASSNLLVGINNCIMSRMMSFY